MSVIRFAGRALFAVPYGVDGYHMLTRPERDEEQISSTVDRVLPVATTLLPDAVLDRLPAEPRTWTRILGGVQLVGALAYATGIGRRGGAWALTLASLPRLGSDRGMINDLGMLGGALVATQDTAGKPSMAWRLVHSRPSVESQAADTTRLAHRASGTMVRGVGAVGTVASASARSALSHVGGAARLITKATRKAVEKASKELER